MRFRCSMLNHFRSGSLNHILVCMHLKLSYCKFRKNESIKISLKRWSKDQMKITRIPMRCIFSLKLDQKQQKCLNIVILAKEWETLARQTVQFFKSGPKIFCHLVQFTINVAVPIFLGDSRIQHGSRSQTSKSSRSRQRILGSKYLLSKYFSTFPSLLKVS